MELSHPQRYESVSERIVNGWMNATNWIKLKAPQCQWCAWQKATTNKHGPEVFVLWSSCIHDSSVQCCFTFTETVGTTPDWGRGAQDGHLNFHTAPELWLVQVQCYFPSTATTGTMRDNRRATSTVTQLLSAVFITHTAMAECCIHDTPGWVLYS